METPNIGAAQGEAGLKGEGIMVWSTAKGDLELRAEGEEGHGRQRLDKQPRCLAASVPELSLWSRNGDALERTFSCLDVKASIAERKLACVGRVRVFSVWGRQSNHRE
jgi:hypothetical protein